MDVLHKKQISINISDRNYFIQAKKFKVSVDGPLIAKYKEKRFKESVIIISAPIYEKNNFYGIVGLVFYTHTFTNIVLQKKLGKTGYAYILNKEGLILIHPHKELILNLKLFDQPNTKQMKYVAQVKKKGTVIYYLNGIKKIAGLKTIDRNNWVIVFTQNWEENDGTNYPNTNDYID